MQVHDAIAGTCATTLRKELLQQEIKHQLELGATGLLQEDKYLNLEDLETTLGERQEYWLLAINAAWEAKLLWVQQGTACRSQQVCNQLGNIS